MVPIMNNKITRPVFKYQGAKFRSARWIISFFPPHRVYTEAFGGSACVLFQKVRVSAEVYNDVNDELVRVFRVLRDKDKAKELQRLLELTPWAYQEYADSQEDCEDEIEKVRRTIVRSYLSMNARGIVRRNSGFSARLNKATYTFDQAKAWLTYSPVIMSFYKRLQGVVIECRDAGDIIRWYDTDKTLHYVDPPYVNSTWRSRSRVYEKIYDDNEHERLLNQLLNVKGCVVLSGYMNDMYMDMLKGWRVEKRMERNLLNDAREECIWISPRCQEERAGQRGLLDA